MQAFHGRAVPLNSVAGERNRRASDLPGLDSAAPAARRVRQAVCFAPYAAASSRQAGPATGVRAFPAGSGGADGEADGHSQVEGAGPLQVVPAEPEHAVVGFTGRHQFPAAPGADEPVADMDQPERRDGHR